jgi:cation:H+ antiporter
MSAATILSVLLGVGLLVAGAEILVRGAARFALAIGISPLIVGLTVVAFATSAPEMAVSIGAAAAGQPEIALGNVLGSNIFNVLFILGLSALVAPLVVSAQLVRLDVPVMIGVSLLVVLMALDGGLDRMDGVALLLGAVGYTAFLVRQAGREKRADAAGEAPGPPRPRRQMLIDGLLIAGGLVFLVLGSRLLLGGAVVLADALGISPLVIGLTFVAGGTSLPEVATSVAAALRGQRDLAVGNVVGSNIFNLLLVLGGAAALPGGGIQIASGVLGFDLPVMLAVSVACLPIFFTGHSIDRWEGALFLAYYAAFTAYLFLTATRHPALPVFSAVMLAFVIPLTVVTLAVIAGREVRRRRSMRLSRSRDATSRS